jgi:hypothetical protein
MRTLDGRQTRFENQHLLVPFKVVLDCHQVLHPFRAVQHSRITGRILIKNIDRRRNLLLMMQRKNRENRLNTTTRRPTGVQSSI